MKVEVAADAAALAQAAAQRFVQDLAAIAQAGRRPSIVLTGGTIAGQMYAAIDGDGVDWGNLDFYFGDERFVPEGHTDRNDLAARMAFLDRLAVPPECIHAMPAHDCALGTAEAADQYAATLPHTPFDLVLLGIGEDGHIASLFPGFAQLRETERRVVEVFDSPKPPSVRLSMTLPTLNHARRVWLLASGGAKAEAVAAAVAGPAASELPVTRVAGQEETLLLLDRAAARLLDA